MPALVALGFLFLFSYGQAALNPAGSKCGQKRCETTEYCSPFDSQCVPCSSICEPSGHNHQPDLCVKDCQGKIKKNFFYLFNFEEKTRNPSEYFSYTRCIDSFLRSLRNGPSPGALGP